MGYPENKELSTLVTLLSGIVKRSPTLILTLKRNHKKTLEEITEYCVGTTYPENRQGPNLVSLLSNSSAIDYTIPTQGTSYCKDFPEH